MICDSCKFRLLINDREFHCAAYVHGWAFISDIACEITMPKECDKKIIGKSLYVGKELKSGEFWEIAGKHITAKDWEEWKIENND